MTGGCHFFGARIGAFPAPDLPSAMFFHWEFQLESATWWLDLIRILAFFIAAGIVSRISNRLARPLVGLSYFAPRTQTPRPERRKTLQSLIASGINLLAFGAAAVASLGLFVSAETLVWMVGLFSLAFGWGARPLISDVLGSISLLFEDTFAVGEKVEIMGVEGIIEGITWRATFLRAPTGELYVIPNGEIRLVRNFSRSRFSTTNVTLKIAAADLGQALPMLEALGHEAMHLLPNLIEPWQVISDTGVIGQQTELTLLAKARFGQAADMRPRLLSLVQERLAEAEITLVD